MHTLFPAVLIALFPGPQLETSCTCSTYYIAHCYQLMYRTIRCAWSYCVLMQQQPLQKVECLHNVSLSALQLENGEEILVFDSQQGYVTAVRKSPGDMHAQAHNYITA